MLETKQYQTILVGVDGSDQAFQAFDKAIAVAKRNHAKIILTHVIENRYFDNLAFTMSITDLLDVETERSKSLLEEYKEYAKKKDFTRIEVVLSYGSAKTLMAVELPKKYQIDLIMVGQSGLNAVERVMVGSVSEYVVRHASCDVLIVRAKENLDEPEKE